MNIRIFSMTSIDIINDKSFCVYNTIFQVKYLISNEDKSYRILC